MKEFLCRLLLPLVLVVVPVLSARAQSIAITDVRVVDGNGGTPIEHGTIIVRGKQIVAVGPVSEVTIPPGTRRINGEGKTALPGLADMHVHLVGGWDGRNVDLIGYQRYLNALLYAGVTTVLDTGNVGPFVLQLRAETAAGRITGSRIYCVGPLLDGSDPEWPAISLSIVSKEQVPGVIGTLAASKFDLVKLYVGLSDPLVRAISVEANKQHLRTIIDQWERNGSTELMQTGIAGFAHFPSYTISDDGIAAAKQHGIFFISTLIAQEASARRRFGDLSFLKDPLIADTSSRSSLDALRQEASRKLNPKEEERRKRALKGFFEAEGNVKRLKEAGVLFAAGTDAAYPGDFQGEGMHHELELLVESGLTPLEAITTATKNAATILNAASEWGTLQNGKLANILLVDGKPDRNITDTRRISLVIKEGSILDRGKLKLDPVRDPDYQPVDQLLSVSP